MGRCRVGIVIPALNESATIARVVEAVRTYGEAIVVNDGSTDDTESLARNAGAVVVSHAINCGYDQALNSGFKKAADLGCEIIISVDADGQHDPSLIEKFIAGVQSGADVVVGVRSSRPRFAEHLFAFYTSLRFGICDPLCGMKAYRMEVYRAQGYFDSYSSIGTELMIFAAKQGCRIGQIPFVVRERRDSPRFGNLMISNLKILRAMLRSFRKGAY